MSPTRTATSTTSPQLQQVLHHYSLPHTHMSQVVRSARSAQCAVCFLCEPDLPHCPISLSPSDEADPWCLANAPFLPLTISSEPHVSPLCTRWDVADACLAFFLVPGVCRMQQANGQFPMAHPPASSNGQHLRSEYSNGEPEGTEMAKMPQF